MTDAIKNSISDEDVEWTMTWGKDKYPDKPETEQVFENDKALAHLLINDVVMLNSYWWKRRGDDTRWTEDESKAIAVAVVCNDVFAWACADAEPLPYDEIETLYKAWRFDPDYGVIKWCCAQRNQKPQKPLEDMMRNAGAWDEVMDKLGDNTMDADVKAMLRQWVQMATKPDPQTVQLDG